MNNNKKLLTALAVIGVGFSVSTRASIIFDDFNVDEGHFASTPTASGTTAGILTTSTADRATTPSPFEGAGFERLTLNVNGTTTSRVRFLSGSGAPANNVSFTTSASATDGWIGFYARLSSGAVGAWQVGINLDSTANSGATMLGSTRTTLPADDLWHLYEWDLDGTSWGQVSGIGGYASMAAALAAGDPHSWTIDSIYIYSSGNVSGSPVVDLDFVAKSDSGSIAALVPVPEPSIAALAVLGGGMALVFFRRRMA